VRVLLLALVLLPQARAAHPRLFITKLDEIVAKSKRAPWSGRVDELKETTHGKALHWLLTGDEKSAKACLDELKKTNPDDGYGLYAQGPIFTLPVAYDWLWSWRGFSDADKKAVEAKIAKTADQSVEFLKGRDDSVWHTSAPRSLMGVALAGVALDRADYLAFAREYFDKTYSPAMASLDGGGVAGMSYSMEEGFAPMCYAALALGIKKCDWMEKRAHYIAHQVLPDLTFQRWGDCVTGSRCSFRDEGRHVIDMLARLTGSASAKWLSSQTAKRWPNKQGYHESVLPDFFLFGEEAKETAIDAPLEELFGEKQIGQAFMRTGWGADDTVVFFKAGDYFDNHGHPDQGQFTIYRKGHLAIDSGCYDSFGSKHHKGYALTTAAHNVVLFGTDKEGGQRALSKQDSQDVADHEAKKKSAGFETADIVAWKSEKEYTYVSADLTAACDAKTVQLWTRELVWLKKGVLIVYDKTVSSVAPRWLLHGVSEPLDSLRSLAAGPEIKGPAWSFSQKESTLVGVTLLPKKAAIKKVGPGCMIDGQDFATDKPGEYGVPGAWRIEVSGNATFLHVLFPLDAGASAPSAKLVEEGASVGADVSGKKVLFKKEGVSRTVTVR